MPELPPHILITRPLGQQISFAHECRKLEFEVSHIPCLAIEAFDAGKLLGPLVDEAEIVLFTSQNAVLHAHEQHALPWFGVQVHAIGKATANLLSTFNQPLSLQPLAPFNSESCVRQLESLPAQSLLIVKGVDGRSLIAEQLRPLGWTVSTHDVYRRTLPIVSSVSITETFEKQPPDLISIGSNETLLNLMTLARDHEPTLLRSRLLVNSQRCSELAASIGFTRAPLIAIPAGDEGQLIALRAWLSTR